MLRRLPLLLLLVLLLLPSSASGKGKGRFVTIEGDDSYLTAAGETLTGLQTISGRTYYF